MGKKLKKNIKKICHSPPYFPFKDTPFALSMGLVKVPNSDWFKIFDLKERALQLEAKRNFLASIHKDVFMADASALAASTEVLNLMLENLTTYRPDLYVINNNIIKLKPHKYFEGEEFLTNLNANGIHPLDLAARLVQEDLLIMLPPNKKQKGWWLAAGSLTFPSRWNLKKKFRKIMDTIHAPVPFYKGELETPTNNFFDKMPYDDIFERHNWSLHDTPSLRQDGTKPFVEKTGINSKNAGEHLWLRVERQTLKKLQRTGAILFTIRTYVDPLKEIVNFEGVAKRLNIALSFLPPEMHAYKNNNDFLDSVQKYLEQFES
jgi:dimethylamine monooxygenase subunit A